MISDNSPLGEEGSVVPVSHVNVFLCKYEKADLRICWFIFL